MVLPKYQHEKTAADAAAPKASPKKRGRKPATGDTPSKAKARDATRAASSEPPTKKRTKASSAAVEIAAANVTAAKRASIAQAVKEAQCIPAAAREMLCSSLNGACSVTGPFHAFQEKVLRMLNTALNDIQTDKTRQVQKAAGINARVRGDLERFKKVQLDAEAAVAGSNADIKKQEAALSACTASQQPIKLALENSQTELQHGDTSIGVAAMESEQLRSARARMVDGNPEATLAMLQKLSSGWNVAPDKQANLTLLEGEICQRIAMLSETISKAAAARVVLVDNVVAAQTSLDAANGRRQAFAEALARTQSVRHERVATLKAKMQTVKQQKTFVSQTLKAWNILQRQSAEFQEGPHAAFKDIVSAIEKHHRICIFDGEKTSTDVAVTAPPKVATAVEQHGHGDKNEAPLLARAGTPVIDRVQRHAYLRRRSAVLPLHCFSRLSLMVRRSISNRRSSMGTTASDTVPSAKASASDSDGEDAMGDVQKQTEQPRRDSGAFDGALDIPTPSRKSFGGRSQ